MSWAKIIANTSILFGITLVFLAFRERVLIDHNRFCPGFGNKSRAKLT